MLEIGNKNKMLKNLVVSTEKEMLWICDPL